MNLKYKNIQWIVQRNLISTSDLEVLKESCHKFGIQCTELDIIPFSNTFPNLESTANSILYGTTVFIALACKDENLRKGVFINDANFTIENYLDKWGKNMLNYGASISTFAELINNQHYSPDTLLFIRPNDDSKSFSGEIKRYDEVTDWYNSLTAIENLRLLDNTKIIVSEPYNIRCEWRLWIVNKQVIAATKYREYFTLRTEKGCPTEVVTFAEERCQEYTPHDIFVMDVCICGDDYYIVECGCVNSAGFYDANVDEIVKQVSDYYLSAILNIDSPIEKNSNNKLD